MINSVASIEAGTALADEVGAAYVQADVSREVEAVRLVDATVERFGRLDIVINNAGWTKVIPHADLEAVTDDVWERILGTNLMGTWYVSRAAVPALRSAGSGSIVNISSVAGLRAIGSSIPYAVSKAAINHLTVLMAKALGPEIRVNAVAPGLIDTPWTEDWDDMRRVIERTAPLARSGRPEDIAEICLGLIRSAYVTGTVVAADGGLIL